MTTRDAAALLSTMLGRRIDPQLLTVWRYRGVGPHFVQEGRRVYYKRSDLVAYVNEVQRYKLVGLKRLVEVLVRAAPDLLADYGDAGLLYEDMVALNKGRGSLQALDAERLVRDMCPWLSIEEAAQIVGEALS